jgi:hypothetical protein
MFAKPHVAFSADSIQILYRLQQSTQLKCKIFNNLKQFQLVKLYFLDMFFLDGEVYNIMRQVFNETNGHCLLGPGKHTAYN